MPTRSAAAAHQRGRYVLCDHLATLSALSILHGSRILRMLSWSLGHTNGYPDPPWAGYPITTTWHPSPLRCLQRRRCPSLAVSKGLPPPVIVRALSSLQLPLAVGGNLPFLSSAVSIGNALVAGWESHRAKTGMSTRGLKKRGEESQSAADTGEELSGLAGGCIIDPDGLYKPGGSAFLVVELVVDATR